MSFREGNRTRKRDNTVNTVSADLVYPEDIDRRMGWSLGTAARLARRRKLPHYVLPDGAIRFKLKEVEGLVCHVPCARERHAV
jgi:hypothetical protein